jgi:hypothetical protein
LVAAMSRDLRKYIRSTNIQLAIGAILLLFILGIGLIYLIFGPGAAMMGIICLLAGLSPVILIMLILFLLDWIVKRARSE